MITSLLIICTLFIAFVEKPHLFKKPIKAEKIAVIVLLLIIAGVSYFKEHNNDLQQDHATKTIDSLQVESKYLNRLVDTLRKENKVAQKEYIDSFINFHLYTTDLLAQYGLKVDTLTGTINRFDQSIQKEVLPSLYVHENPQIEHINGEPMITFTMQSLNADAHILFQRYIYLAVGGNGVIDTNSVMIINSDANNYTTILPKDLEKSCMVFPDRWSEDSKFKKSDHFLLALEIFYKSKGNREQAPIRKIYEVFLGTTYIIREVPSDVHFRISLFYKRRGIWPKFYNL